MGPVTEFDSFMSAGKKKNIKMIYIENFFLFRIKKASNFIVNLTIRREPLDLKKTLSL
jgi:hypothetical protein